jgi:hypothetical protein
MNQKPSPLSRLKALTEEQCDQLFETLRAMPYFLGVKHCAEQWGVQTSVSGLRRWWKRESARRMRADLRAAVKASEKFDSAVDAGTLDARANNALRAAFWGALANRDVDSIETLGKMVLGYNADARDAERLTRLLKAERDLEESARANAALAARIAGLEARLEDAGKTAPADPNKVMDELDRHLGVKK